MNPSLEERRITNLLFDSYLGPHLDRINDGDWNYFANLRYRQEASVAVSALSRLRRYVSKLEAIVDAKDAA